MATYRESWRRVHNFGNAELLEWNRLLENRKLGDDIRSIQSKFGLPLSLQGSQPLFENPTYTAWMGWDVRNTTQRIRLNKRCKTLVQKARRLIHKYQIPSQYFGSLWNHLMTGKEGPSYRSGGFPTYTFRKNDFGEWTHQCILTPETDLGNPLVMNDIRDWQVKHKTMPPRPLQVGKAKDWLQVWEWRNRNPDISDRQIADMLGVHRVTVSRAMERLDKEHPP